MVESEEAITLLCMEAFLSVKNTLKKATLLGFSEALGPILLTDVRNKSRESTDAVQSFGGWC